MQPNNTILVIEADLPISDVIGEILRDAGHTVCSMHDRAGALTAIEHEMPALILLDHVQANINESGLHAAMQREHQTDAPIVTMTTSRVIAAALSAAGSQPCLIKSFALDELLTCVAHYIHPASNTIRRSLN